MNPYGAIALTFVHWRFSMSIEDFNNETIVIFQIEPKRVS
jgi:hypothetical protein